MSGERQRTRVIIIGEKFIRIARGGMVEFKANTVTSNPHKTLARIDLWGKQWLANAIKVSPQPGFIS